MQRKSIAEIILRKIIQYTAVIIVFFASLMLSIELGVLNNSEKKKTEIMLHSFEAQAAGLISSGNYPQLNLLLNLLCENLSCSSALIVNSHNVVVASFPDGTLVNRTINSAETMMKYTMPIKSAWGAILGKVLIERSESWVGAFTLKVVGAILLLILVQFGMLFLILKKLLRKQLRELSGVIETFDFNVTMAKETDVVSIEALQIQRLLVKHASTIEELRKAERSAEENKRLFELASQVSHDIRSPLSALEMSVSDLNNIPEQRRLILRSAINRIRDIANSLLKTGRSSNGYLEIAVGLGNGALNEPDLIDNQKNTLLAPLLDSIVSEKRMQYRSLINALVDFQQNEESYCAVRARSSQLGHEIKIG